MNWIPGKSNLMAKILIIPFVIIIFQIILGWVAFRSFSFQRNILIYIYKTRFRAYRTSSNIRNDINEIHANMYKIVCMLTANAAVSSSTVVASDNSSSVDIRKRMEALGIVQLSALTNVTKLLDSTLKSKNLMSEEKRLYEAVKANLTQY